jgi:hypothetical protein
MVIFFDGSTARGNSTLNGSGQAVLMISSLAQGSHSMTASYGGDANFSASPSQAVTEIVNAAGCSGIPPVTTASLAGTLGNSGWYRSPVLVTLTATDAGSTVRQTLFTLDGAPQATYAGPFTIASDGVQQLSFYSLDTCNNIETAKTIQVKIDQTPPTIACSLNPLPNANGWNKTSVTISFAASDPVSGLASVSPPVTLTGQGANQSVSGMATDNAGNTASISCVVNIDLTPPEAYLQFDPTTKDVDVYGTDALSGVAPGPVAPISVQPATADGDEHGNADLRTYKVLDLAGNSLLLIVKVSKDERHVGWHLLSLRYQGNPALTPTDNHARIEWLFNDDGVLKTLEQQIRVGEGKEAQTVLALFGSRENETVIEVEGSGWQKPIKKPGLDLLRLATQVGKLIIQF